MKRIYSLSLILILMIVFASCDKTETSYTTMAITIPVEVTDTTSTTSKSSLAGYDFSGSVTESLEDNDNINEYLDILKGIRVEDFYVTFSGLQNNQIIENIDISVEGVGVIASIENVSLSNLSYQPEVNSSLMILIGYILISEKQITVSVSGTTNKAPMNFNVETYFFLNIETSPL
jgi:hypothetical protein